MFIVSHRRATFRQLMLLVGMLWFGVTPSIAANVLKREPAEGQLKARPARPRVEASRQR